MTAQPIRADRGCAASDYDRLLEERIELGRLYMDYLSHLRLTAPQAVLLFHRVLHLDAQLSADSRYDGDHLAVVSVAEDARFHQPPAVPLDHDSAPCGLCRKLRLGLGVDVVLPHHGEAA